MRIVSVKIENFRGIKTTHLLLNKHTVIVGDNNTGKSTILEAIDLVLGPERLSRHPIIDEHDFYAGNYIGTEEQKPSIVVEVILIDLNDEQAAHFRNHIEWYNTSTNSLLDGPPAEATDQPEINAALRVSFNGRYNEADDDFEGETFFQSPTNEDESFEKFRTTDKRICGFLFLRTVRTGTRALSLEKGTLLDVILRLQDLRPQMWEDILNQLRGIPIAEDPKLGITDILNSVHEMARSFVSAEWVKNPELKVSTLTRVELRKVLTVFLGTGSFDNAGKEYAAPYHHQGTGTINMLVLSLLVIIADLKQNVIFAMEEPEIAIPPHAQKRIIDRVTHSTAQALFTSHSPYVLEEFKPDQILVTKREKGILTGTAASYPPAVRPKKYKEEFRRKFCEALLARRVLIVEGRTEYDAIVSAARRLNELNPETYFSLEAMGIALVNAETDSQIAPIGEFYKAIGKDVFAIFDKQTTESLALITATVDHPFESPEKGFENLMLKQTSESSLRRHAISIVGDWPSHLSSTLPTTTSTVEELRKSLFGFFQWAKGNGACSDLLAQCTLAEMPEFIVKTLDSISTLTNTEAKSPDVETTVV